MASAKAADSAVSHRTAMAAGLARSSRGAPTRPVGVSFLNLLLSSMAPPTLQAHKLKLRLNGFCRWEPDQKGAPSIWYRSAASFFMATSEDSEPLIWYILEGFGTMTYATSQPSNEGSFAAICRASSRVSRFA